MTMPFSGVLRAITLPSLVLAFCATVGAQPGPAEGPPAGDSARGTGASVEQTVALWREVAGGLDLALAESKRVLMGTRPTDEAAPAWFVRHEADRNFFIVSPQGGAGMQLISLHKSAPTRPSPSADFEWFQTRFRPEVRSLQKANREVMPRAILLSEQAQRLAEAIGEWEAVPAEVRPTGIVCDKPFERRYWAHHCFEALDHAIADRDVRLCKEMADELASATFALADLHRWQDFLLEQELAALSFQARCEDLYRSRDADYGSGYVSRERLGLFPGGTSLITSLTNLLEVERQAALLFRIPQEYLEIGLTGDSRVRRTALRKAPAALWLPPDVRDEFARLRTRLSEANRRTWDRAAHSRYNRSYLASMLFRAKVSHSCDGLSTVLERFDRLYPDGDEAALMGVIFCRAGDFGGGDDWDDRYDPRVLSAAAKLTGDNAEAILKAQEIASHTFGNWGNYAQTSSLHEALDRRQFDCSRATDLIGALFRNSGRFGFYNLRWTTGKAAHTMAAAVVGSGPERRTLVVDGLDLRQESADLWPRDYLAGHPWPAGLFENADPPYAIEMHVRGIDSYVWVEGYIVQGPNAGTFAQTEIPYLPARPKPSLAWIDADLAATPRHGP